MSHIHTDTVMHVHENWEKWNNNFLGPARGIKNEIPKWYDIQSVHNFIQHFGPFRFKWWPFRVQLMKIIKLFINPEDKMRSGVTRLALFFVHGNTILLKVLCLGQSWLGRYMVHNRGRLKQRIDREYHQLPSDRFKACVFGWKCHDSWIIIVAYWNWLTYELGHFCAICELWRIGWKFLWNQPS